MAWFMQEVYNSYPIWHSLSIKNRFISALLLRVIFGVPHISSYENSLLRRLTIVTVRILQTVSPASQLIDLLPSLDVLPPWIARWKKWGNEIFEEIDGLVRGSYVDGLKDVSGLNRVGCWEGWRDDRWLIDRRLLRRSRLWRLKKGWRTGVLLG